MQEVPLNSFGNANPAPLNTDEYLRQYYYAQWQQYYAMLWQQYYAQQQAYGGGYQPAPIQQEPQPVYSHGGAFEALPVVPAKLKSAEKEIFISYSTRNPKEAAFVCRKLEEAGMRCWIAPRDLLPGTNFADNIEAALAGARCMVLISSRHSVTSPWVEGEVNTAFSNGMPILVYQIEPVQLSGAMKVMIEKFQTLVASGDPEKDAGTLAYNAMILTGRTPAPEGYSAAGTRAVPAVRPSAAAKPRSARAPAKRTPAAAPSFVPAQAQAFPSAQPPAAGVPATMPQPAGTRQTKGSFTNSPLAVVLVAAVTVIVVLLLLLLTARFWIPLLPSALTGS